MIQIQRYKKNDLYEECDSGIRYEKCNLNTRNMTRMKNVIKVLRNEKYDLDTKNAIIR